MIKETEQNLSIAFCKSFMDTFETFENQDQRKAYFWELRPPKRTALITKGLCPLIPLRNHHWFTSCNFSLNLPSMPFDVYLARRRGFVVAVELQFSALELWAMVISKEEEKSEPLY